MLNKLSFKPSILVIEDAESILLAIKDFFLTMCDVKGVKSASEAEDYVALLKENKSLLHLAIIDINLPDGNGIELSEYLHKVFPDIKIILMTSYDINDYIDYIYKSNLDQILSKHSHFNLYDLYVCVYKMLSGDIFGIEKYFENIKVFYPTEMKNNLVPKNGEVFSIQIRSMEERLYWTDEIADILKKERGISESLSKLVLDEITTNAMVRAPKFEDGQYKYQTRNIETDTLIPQEDVILDPEDYFLIQYGYYDDWVILTCVDPHGNLRKKEVLYRLRRHISQNTPTGLPDGLSDTHGRGIFLLREHLTNLVYNIKKDRKTEVLCFYHSTQDLPYKNISVYEID